MQSDIITHGYSCGIHGCTTVTVTHKGGGDMSASAWLKNDKAPSVDVMDMTHRMAIDLEPKNTGVDVATERKDGDGLTIKTSLMCRTSQGEWEFLLVNEGVIMLIDGQCVLVRR
jgi:hypothetical protein